MTQRGRDPASPRLHSPSVRAPPHPPPRRVPSSPQTARKHGGATRPHCNLHPAALTTAHDGTGVLLRYIQPPAPLAHRPSCPPNPQSPIRLADGSLRPPVSSAAAPSAAGIEGFWPAPLEDPDRCLRRRQGEVACAARRCKVSTQLNLDQSIWTSAPNLNQIHGRYFGAKAPSQGYGQKETRQDRLQL